MPDKVLDVLRSKERSFSSHTDLSDVLGEADVLYVTRVQQERFESAEEYAKFKGAYVITPEVMDTAKGTAVLMHPLPRVDEISTKVDSDPRAAYFRQMRNGMLMRMALLALVLGARAE